MSSRQMVSLRDRHVGAPLEIAIVGSGISGMSAAWLLSRHHRVTVFEKDGRLGGHANTVMVQAGDRTVAVDTGFIVYNEANYPTWSPLFDHLQVPTKRSTMSFAVSIDHGALEYSGGDKLNGLIGQRRNLVRPRFWSMVQDVLRFYREAPRDLSLGRLEGVTLGDYVAAAGYSDAFVEDSSAADGGGDLVFAAGGDARPFCRVDRALLRQSRPAAAGEPAAMAHGRRRLARICAAPDRVLCRRVRLRCGARKVVRRGRGAWVEDETGALSHSTRS